jgi:D-arginine dehydrogenase
MYFAASAMSSDKRIAVIGAGMAGASIAYELAPHFKVTVLEQEVQPGFHSTGRSAAVFSEDYGNRAVRAITALSRQFLLQPPFDDVERPLLTPRGAVFIANAGQRKVLEVMHLERQRDSAKNTLLSQKELLALVPVLNSEWQSALWESQAMDIDVTTLHQAYLRHAKRRGATVLCNSGVVGMTLKSGEWRVELEGGALEFDLIVNAAGAWADRIAGFAKVAPLGLLPKRRTAFLFAPPPNVQYKNWPVVIDVEEGFYFKPEGELMLGSPADETPHTATDVQPDDLDVATAIDRIERATTLRINRVTAAWAGLRTFSRDKSPVLGFDPRVPHFFWLAGQGGYGIQMAPALALASASLIREGRLPDTFVRGDLTEKTIGPSRLIR